MLKSCVVQSFLEFYKNWQHATKRIFFLQANPGVVTCFEGYLHGLESGDQVTFTEVVGMSAVNGTTHVVKGKDSMHDECMLCFCNWRYAYLQSTTQISITCFGKNSAISLIGNFAFQMYNTMAWYVAVGLIELLVSTSTSMKMELSAHYVHNAHGALL